MIVGIFDKNIGKVVKTYISNSINLQSGFSGSNFEYFEVTPGNFLEGYFWNGSEIIYDQAFEPPAVDPIFAVKEIIKDAMVFGSTMLIEFASENVLMGITQAGKTKEVSEYLQKVTLYIQTGSLYEVINEIDRLIAEGLPLELEPFITQPRLLEFKQKIVTYLGG